jgi:hypothetical protein
VVLNGLQAQRVPSRRVDGDDGIVLVLFALALTAVMIMAALVIDLGDSRQVARQAQASSDAAALAGAQYLPLNAASSTAAATAKQKAAAYAANNILGATVAPSSATCAPGVPANSSCYTAQGATITVATPYLTNYGLIYVSICKGTEPFFGKVVDASGSNVCREAVARRYGGDSIEGVGVIALRQGVGCVDYDLRGSQASRLDVTGAVIANCQSSPPNNISGSNAAINATGFYSVGPCPTHASCVGDGATPTIPMPGPVADPLGGLAEPTASEAGFNHVTVAQYNALSCLDGMYRVTGAADIQVKSSCTGKTAFTFLVQAGVGGNLKDPYVQNAPTTGTYRGISLFLGRTNTSTIEWNGNSQASATYNGTVYAPAGGVDWGGNIQVFVNGQVIAQTFVLKGGGGPKNEGLVVNPPSDVQPLTFTDDIGLEQ